MEIVANNNWLLLLLLLLPNRIDISQSGSNLRCLASCRSGHRSVRPFVRLSVHLSARPSLRRCARIRASIKPNQANPAPATNYHNHRVLRQFHRSELKVWINGNLFAATALIAWTALFALRRISLREFELNRKLCIYFYHILASTLLQKGVPWWVFTLYKLNLLLKVSSCIGKNDLSDLSSS